MRNRKALRYFAVMLTAFAATVLGWTQLVEERVIARGQVRNLSVSSVYNGRVYVATSSETMLAVYDFSVQPPLRGSINYPGNAPRMATALLVEGNYAYIYYAHNSQGKLAIVDVSNPSAPTLVSELPYSSTEYVLSIAKSGNYLYLFVPQNDFAVVNVANPASPTLVRQVTASAVRGVVVGNRLYTAEGSNGVCIYNIAQPDNPTLVATLNNVTNIGNIAAANGRLYALRSYGPPLQLHIFDLSNPDTPTLVHTYPTQRVSGLAALGDFVFLSGYERGTEVLNMANPTNPAQVRLLSHHNVQNADAVSGRVLIQGQSLLMLYNPATQQTTQTTLPYPLKALRRGNALYAVQETELTVIDISNPAMPRVRASAPLALQRESNTDLALIGTNHVAVSCGGILQIFELAGNSLNEVARDETGRSSIGFSDRLSVSGDTLAIYTDSDGIRLYDVANPAAPQLQGTVSGSTGKFELQGNLLYSVRSGVSRTLEIYDVSILSAPQLIGSVNLPQVNFITDIAVGAGYALISDYQGNLALVDARTPNAPQVVAQHSLASYTYPRIAYDGAAGVFYVYDGDNRKMAMFRVSDFPSLTPVANFTTPRPMYTFSFYNEVVFGAGREEGLIWYRNTLLGGPSVGITSVSPTRGANRGRLRIRILGTGFATGATVRLERGSEQIPATEVQVISNSELQVDFDFNGQPENTLWDVVVRNPDNQEGRLVNGFSIVPAVPAVTSISPTSVQPLSDITLTINGSLFVPGAQVTLLPPSDLSVDAISAQVEYLSQNTLRARFNLAPYQVINLPSFGVEAAIQVRNPNGQTSNQVALVIRPPALSLSAPNQAEVPSDAQVLTFEVTVSNSIATEPLQAILRGYVGSTLRTIPASQVQLLGNNRWRLTFPAAELVPDNFSQGWTLEVIHLGASTSSFLSTYRPYAAKVYSPLFVDNLIQEAEVSVYITNDSPNTTVVLRQGDRTIEPTSIQRRDASLPAVKELRLRYPIRLEDLGSWGAEVRYENGRRVVVAEAVRVERGRPFVTQVHANSYLIWQADHQVVFQGSRFNPQLRVRAIVENQEAAVDSRVIEASQVRVSTDRRQLTATFQFAGRLRHGARLRFEIYSPYTETAQAYDWRTFGSGKVRISNLSAPSFFRAGVGDTFTVQVSVGALPDAPVVVLPIPFTEQDLESGLWDFEYQIREYSYFPSLNRLIDTGRRTLTRENAVLIARLSPMAPFSTRYVEFRVRVIARGRAAPPEPAPQLRSRGLFAVFLGASGLLIGGAYVLDAACRFVSWYNLQLAATIADAAGINQTQAQRWADWLLNNPQNVRRLLDLYSVGEKSVFEHLMSSLSSEAINEGGRILREAASLACAQFIIDKFFGRIPYGSEQYNQFRDNLSEAFLRAYDAYKQIRESGSSEGAAAAYQNAVNEFNGLILKHALLNDVLEPPEGIDPQSFAPDTLGIILNTGLSTFLSAAADCLQRNQRINELFDRLSIDPKPVRTSWDPNEKRGSAGLDGYIAADTSITYELLFENLPAATAGAQEVLVEDALPAALDENTIEFLHVEVGNKRVVLPENTTTLNTTIDLRPERPVIVRVVSQYDASTRKLSVRFSGLDPNTNNYYEDGFLPPNQNPPQGEGKVVFRIRPRAETPSATVIENRAVITFDPHLQANPPIVTNTHRLTLDKRPPTVTVEVPASAVPETRAQVSWRAVDDASGVDEVEIWVQEGENARRVGRARASGERTETGTVQIRARRFGDETRLLARAVDRVGNTNPLGTEPLAVIRMGQPPQFSAGLHLLGIPLRPDATDLQPLFGFENNQWATYDPTSGQYVQYPDTNAAPAVGRGFWTLLPNAVQPNLAGELPDPETPYSIELRPGWNLIANPWTEPLVWHRNAVQVRVQGVARPLSEATQFVEPYLWGWEPNPSNPQGGRYVLVSDAQILPGMQTTLLPWRGYWIYAKQACTLLIPTPEQAALFTGLTRSYRLDRNGGWSFRIGAQLGDTYDEVLIGVAEGERGIQVATPPNPPTRSAQAGVQLRLIREGTPLEADVQPRTRSKPTWTLELSVPPTTTEHARPLLITVPDLAQLPRGVNPVLRDMQTGEQRFLRGSAGWQIPVPREGLTRTYEVRLVSTSRMLRIFGVHVQSNRSSRQHTVQFTLSDEARVNIAVLAGGQVVRTLEQGRSRSRGIQQAVWDGRDAQGRALPPGTYQILIQAESDDGQLARASVPLVLTR